MADGTHQLATLAIGQVCVRCVMDESDPDIAFDEHGVCSHCRHFDVAVAPRLLGPEEKAAVLARHVERIRADGRGKPYDCILGVSGGVDSSYVALKAVRELGLRPLIVHLDNGWNSEQAVRNVESIVRTMELDLETYVVDWPEFRSLQLAFARASVVDIELLTDHAINALVYRTAIRHDVRWILTGINLVTEAVLPMAWVHRKTDLRNLRAIAATQSIEIRSLPTASTIQVRWWRLARRIRTFDVLNCLRYDRADAKAELQEALGWSDYGGKHQESLFTRFYQGHLLPTKFGIDKRRAHVSTLILSGQLTRDEALAELAQPMYDDVQLAIDREFVAKKWSMSVDELDEILAEPPRPHLDFPSDETWFAPIRAVRRLVRPPLHHQGRMGHGTTGGVGPAARATSSAGSGARADRGT